MTPSQLKTARQSLGLSQKGLAAALGWSTGQQVSNLETGSRTITKQTELAVECILRRKKGSK
jgi:Helix-turn-helix.